MDDIDRQLLAELQTDAGRPLHALGERVGLSAAAVQRRIAGYRRSGLIERTVAQLDRRKAGLPITVIALVTFERDSPNGTASLIDELWRIGRVLQIHELAGDRDLTITYAAPDLDDYSNTVLNLLDEHPNVKRVETHVALRTHKSTTALPVEPVPELQ